MDEQEGRGDLVDIVTRIAIQAHSRRRFLKRLGALSIALSAAVGLSRGLRPETVEAEGALSPDSIVCPQNCLGPCNHSPSACLSGGMSCAFYCDRCCWINCYQADGYWVAEYYNHVWTCIWNCTLNSCSC
jgi:anaerobic selenocysteine-containing dehydrogenase